MQVLFSMRTVMAQMCDGDRMFVATDAPAFYKELPGVRIIELLPDEIQRLRGKHDFFWRIKIKVIERIAEEYPEENLMYLDGDTFLYGSLDAMKERMNHGVGMMHLREKCPGAIKGNAQKMWETIGNRSYDGVKVDESKVMWNAGVVALPGGKSVEVAQHALRICDAMLEDGAFPVLVEQYSLSLAITDTLENVQEADEFIGHYWHNKQQWSKFIASFLARSYMKHRSLEEEFEVLRHMNLRRTQKWLEVKRKLAKLF